MKLTRTGEDWMDWEPEAFNRRQSRAPGSAAAPSGVTESSTVGIEQRVRWIALAALCVFAAMCVPFWFGRVYVLDDLGAFHLPLRDFYSKQLTAGEAFDWMPSLYCGFYVTGEGQLGGYHPLHWLLYRTLPLGTAFNLEVLLNFPFIAIGTYLLLRRVVVRRDAAAFGALIFTFCSFNLLHFVHPNAIAVIAHLPWLLWLIDLVISRQSYWAGFGIALLTGLQLLLGYPQYVWFSLVCEAGFAGWQVYRTSGLLMSLGVLAAAKLLGLAVGAAQVLPTIDALHESTRQTVDAAFRNSGSLHPLNVVQLLEPYLFRQRVVGANTHELGLYAGAVPIVLCAWLLLTTRRKLPANAVIIAVATFGVLALVYAFGEFGPLYRWQAVLPVVGDFRFPCRATVLFQLSIAVLSAFAFARLTKDPVPQSQALWIVPIVSAAVMVAACFLWPEQLADPLLIAINPLLITFATFLILRVQRGEAWATVALVFFAAADLGVYGLTFALQNTSDLNEFAADAAHPPKGTQWRVLAEDPHDPTGLRVGNQMLLAGFSRADGYAGLEPARKLDPSEAKSLRHANVRYVRDDATDKWKTYKPLGRAHFNGKLPNTSIVVTRDRPGSIDIATRSPTGRTLVVSESFHPGWRATVDGRVVPVVLADGDFLGLPVPSGEHQIELRFEPESLRQGLLLSMCGLSFTVGWGAVALRRYVAVRFPKSAIVHLKH